MTSNKTQTTLSDLCSICTTQPPKYQCPRCTLRTCSLPCALRHKKWSQCSGIRDPTVYVKRSRLATASGIDHDYNFLTSVERAVANADRDAENRGVELEFGGARLPPKMGQGERLRTAVEEGGVKVQRAPVGMSRQRANGTHLSARKNIMWTVEWIHPQGTKSHSQCLEDATVHSLYTEGTQAPSRKRKRKHLHGRSDRDRNIPKKAKTPDRHESTDPVDDGEDANSTVKSEPDQIPRESLHSVNGAKDAAPPTANNPIANHSQPATPAAASAAAETEEEELSKQPPPTPPPHHYYLVKPFAKTKDRVLIPLNPHSPLRDCLRGQEVFEYPTVQVLEEPPHKLPGGFVLERTYRKRAGGLIQDVDVDVDVEASSKKREDDAKKPVMNAKGAAAQVEVGS